MMMMKMQVHSEILLLLCLLQVTVVILQSFGIPARTRSLSYKENHMNVLEISDEELGAMHDAAMTAFAAARLEIDRVVGLREEKARLVALKQAFGQISADDIAKINASVSMSPAPINTEESVQL